VSKYGGNVGTGAGPVVGGETGTGVAAGGTCVGASGVVTTTVTSGCCGAAVAGGFVGAGVDGAKVGRPLLAGRAHPDSAKTTTNKSDICL